ncbi:MAG: TIGR01777 family oxidoreductase [Bacteroidia bacterium]
MNGNGKIIIAGGTGFMGQRLIDRYVQMGKGVTVISRAEQSIKGVNVVLWNNSVDILNALESAEMVINLAGKSVDCRYSAKNKKAIFDSRINTTQKLGELILNSKNPPKLWINSSTATIYRHAEDRAMTEQDGELGIGFSVNVATAWEKAFFDFALPQTRQIALRTAIVFGKDGGAFHYYKRLAQMGFGGRHGAGNQMFSFVHEDDVFGAIQFLKERKNLFGIFNLSSPKPLTNQQMTKELCEKLGIKVRIPLRKWMLETGAFLLRTETELLLKSRWVIPQRLLNQGFQFKYPDFKSALEGLID